MKKYRIDKSNHILQVLYHSETGIYSICRK